ncbi:unnamed protein product [Fusarium graminearum]|uniref:Complex III subunit 9 n=2 Tax=Fusarium sambucinum species complex TaxID=569360 RepID=A0A0E0RPV7_GIBZE|nr:hypothetical protein FPSE_01818 [Fusarium pseudograminearum CS3096]EYB22144.1 hypothetical protein FG05_01195 [Fusarium graminearum]QPC75690.1 hypothetical protein HYE68_006442 [Fusarium pseudograminearum]EKJ78030.1 hypothetical protein FPSE_01818 [Fusarium pseudograminearum CS3096]PCD22660.1 ubiquinol-cytochrome c reductase subunit 9 [Fusarium graminearum]UZP33658.1 hypothetical protein NXS19_001474 [Fusarium pseudograminearum]
MSPELREFPGLTISRTSPSFNRSLTTPVADVHHRLLAVFQTPNCAIQSKWSLFSTNYLMLATVFSAGFAWEIGFNNVMDKVWDNHNRGRQWKDIRHKFIEGGDEDEE